jgi:hypothetical protein
VLARIELGSGEALFTSGDYERGYAWEGERIHHVIDPRSGRPSRGIAAVTVLHRRSRPGRRRGHHADDRGTRALAGLRPAPRA